jgi:hypothetical protein
VHAPQISGICDDGFADIIATNAESWWTVNKRGKENDTVEITCKLPDNFATEILQESR